MKKTLLLVFAAAVAFASCTSHKNYATHYGSSDTLTLEQREGERHYVSYDYSEDGSVSDTILEQFCYHISWPLGDHPRLQESLLDNIPFVENAKDFDDAITKFLSSTFYEGRPIDLEKEPITGQPDFIEFSIECIKQAPLYTFFVEQSEHHYGSPSFMQMNTFINYDIRNKKIIELADLMDTTDIPSVAKQALKKIRRNKETLELILQEEDDEEITTPLSLFDRWSDYYNFTINIEKKEILLLYPIPPYHHTGLWVRLPLKWLLKQGVKLTPYCMDLFGDKKINGKEMIDFLSTHWRN